VTGSLAYPGSNYFRAYSRIQEVRSWAGSRGVPMVPFEDSGTTNFNWNDVQAFWIPMDLIHSFNGEIPDHVKVIVDYDSPKQDEALRRVLRNRPIGIFRAFSFFRPSSLNIEMESFYWHMPAVLGPNFRSDIVFVDTSRGHPAIRHSQILNTLCFLNDHYKNICSLTDTDIKFYLTGFNPLAAYQEAVSSLSKHFYFCKPLDSIEENLISPVKERIDYERLMARCRLFITDQPDLADIGLFEIVMNHIPIAVLPLSSLVGEATALTYSMQVIANDIALGFNDFLDTVNHSLLRCHTKDLGSLFALGQKKINTGFAADLFRQSWDDMWAWVEKGQIKAPYKQFLDLNKMPVIDSAEAFKRAIGNVPSHESVCFFGGSGRFLKVFSVMEQRTGGIPCIFDNAKEKWGTSICGIPIRSPGHIAEFRPKVIFITTNFAVEVTLQLLEYRTRHQLDYEIFIVEDLDDR
jgi:hypothetical protein